MIDGDLTNLFESVSRLPDTQGPMSDAMIKMMSELQVNLRMAEHQRLMAEERLAAESARASAAEERAGQERMAREAMQAELETLRAAGTKAYDDLMAEHTARLEAEGRANVLSSVQNSETGVHQGIMERMVNRVIAEVTKIVQSRPELPPVVTVAPASYQLDLQRDGAGQLRGILAKPA